MKKSIISISFLLITAATSFAQQTNPSQSLTRDDYLRKSKNQKVAAWVLLGGGTALIGTGFLIFTMHNPSFAAIDAGGVAAAIGVLTTIGTIPLFVASLKNKKRGMTAMAHLKIEDVSAIRGFSKERALFPVLTLKISL